MIARKIRAFNPVPTAWTESQGKNMKIWAAYAIKQTGAVGTILAANANGIVVACGTDALCITKLQVAGSKRLNAQAFLAGNKLTVGELFV